MIIRIAVTLLVYVAACAIHAITHDWFFALIVGFLGVWFTYRIISSWRGRPQRREPMADEDHPS